MIDFTYLCSTYYKSEPPAHVNYLGSVIILYLQTRNRRHRGSSLARVTQRVKARPGLGRLAAGLHSHALGWAPSRFVSNVTCLYFLNSSSIFFSLQAKENSYHTSSPSTECCDIYRQPEKKKKWGNREVQGWSSL